MSATATFFKAFALIFLAEIGDKTQLSAFAMSASSGSAKSRWLVFAGSSAALVATSAIAAFAGNFIGRRIPPRTVSIVAGCLFLLFGVLCLRDAFLQSGGAAQ